MAFSPPEKFPPRRAATVAYISNLLIRHLPNAIQADSGACRCTGFPHARHAAYPAPAPEMSVTEAQPVLHNGNREDATNPQLPELHPLPDVSRPSEAARCR